MSDNLTQIKFTIDSEIVSTFKTRCARENVSMASVISQFMMTGKPIKDIKLNAQTRPMRRKAVLEIISLLENIAQSEESYRDAIPEQFEQRYEAADHACSQLSDAISCLEEAFCP